VTRAEGGLPSIEMMARAAEIVARAVRAGGNALLLGERARQAAAALVGGFEVGDRPFPAVALDGERQLRAIARPGDVVVLFGADERVAAAARDLALPLVHADGALAELVGPLVAQVAPAAPAAPKLLSLDLLVQAREGHRRRGQRVVWTNGCFDVVHAGHVSGLRAARRLGDVLVVGVNDDDMVRRLKGAGRPIHTLAQRLAVLAAFEMVDHLLVFSEPTPREVLARVRPDVHCKGADHAGGARLPEADVVEAHGGVVVFLPLVSELSTTAILEKLDGG
jgi:rfaE bifunctional protein nucleotidyltransferase chain/domain